MKLSESMENYREIVVSGKNRLNSLGILNSYLPEIKQLEKDKEELLNALKDCFNNYSSLKIIKAHNSVKENIKLPIPYIRIGEIKKLSKLIEKHKDNK